MKSNRFIKLLDWYIIKKFLGTYVFAIALIISIAVVFDFNEKMDCCHFLYIKISGELGNYCYVLYGNEL